MNQEIGLIGEVRLEQLRRGEIIRRIVQRNKIIWDAKYQLLDQFFIGTSHWTNFYVGLLEEPEAALFTANEPSIASLFAQEFTSYDEVTRPDIVFDTLDKTTDSTYIFVQNSTAEYCVFTVSTGVTNQILQGIYVVNGSSKVTQPTKVWCTAAFGNDDSSPEELTVNAADVLRIQYTVRIPKA